MTVRPRNFAQVVYRAKRRKLSMPASNHSETSTKLSKSTSPTNHASQISSRRRWRSNAPRAQHAWQVSVRAKANAEDAPELVRIYALLCQLIRRNKNQHRSQAWWRALMALRREMGRLARIQMEMTPGFAERSSGTIGKGSESESVRKRLQREAELQEEKTEVEQLLRDVLLARCYIAFSTVVRDTQFAALGVVLMGVLARIGREVGLPENKVDVEVVRGTTLSQTGVDTGEVVEREWSGSRSRSTLKLGGGSGGGTGDGDGKGKGDGVKPVEERLREDIDLVDVNMEAHADSAGTATGSKRKEKKKKGKKSAIDDLFAGLI